MSGMKTNSFALECFIYQQFWFLRPSEKNIIEGVKYKIYEPLGLLSGFFFFFSSNAFLTNGFGQEIKN